MQFERVKHPRLISTAIAIVTAGLWWLTDYPQSALLQQKILSLCTNLAYGDLEQRQRSALLVASLGPKAIPDLMEFLHTSDFGIRQKVWSGLPRLPSGLRIFAAANVLPPSYSNAVKIGALRALGKFGTDASQAAPRVGQLLGDPDEAVSFEAAKTLSLLGQAGFIEAEKKAKSENVRIRHRAVLAIGQTVPVPEHAEALLLDLLDDKEETIKLAAAASLANLGPSAVPGILRKLSKGNEQTQVAAAKSLAWMHAPKTKVVPTILAILTNAGASARAQALTTLMELNANDDATRIAATRALEDETFQVRKAATNLFSRFQDLEQIEHPPVFLIKTPDSSF